MHSPWLNACVLAGMMVSSAAFAADENPFLPQTGEISTIDMQQQIDEMKETVERTSRDLEDVLLQLPGIAREDFVPGGNNGGSDRQETPELSPTDIVIGTVNGKCLVKKAWGHGGTTLEALDIDGPCVNQAAPDGGNTAPSNDPGTSTR